MVVLDTTIVNIALPRAQGSLHFGTESRQWIITAYSLAFGSLLLLGGRLSDLVGRRRTLLVGLLGFAAASAVGGAATGFAMLAAARAFQGVFAAVLAPAALSTLNVTFTDTRQRGRAFGVYAAIAAGGAVVGLLLGGALTEWLSWRWCLYVNVIFAIPAAAGVLAFVPVRQEPKSVVRLDWPGVVTGSGGLFCLVYGLSNAETDSWSAPLTIVMFVASALLLMMFGVIESRVRAPLLPVHIVADRNRVGSYLAITLAFCSMFSAFLFLTYYMQQNMGYSPLKTGRGISAARRRDRGLGRCGEHPPGAAIRRPAAGAARHADRRRRHVLAVPPRRRLHVRRGCRWSAVDSGCRGGLTFAPAIATATAGVSDADAGVASAMVNTSQQIGGAVGTAALSTIFLGAVTRYVTTHRPPTPVVRDAAAIHGYGVAFSVSCGLFLAGMVLTALLLRSGRPETHPRPETHQRPRDPHQRPRDASRRLDQPADRSDEDTQPNRIAELLDRGINREAVDMILDLELRITQLEA